MADFVAVLKKTLDGLGETTPASRARVYEKARATIAAKLAALSPPPPPGVSDRQKRALEDAIAAIEKEYAAKSDPLSELENVFASLKNPQPKPLAQPAVKTGAWPKAAPAASTLRSANVEKSAAPQLAGTDPSADFDDREDRDDYALRRVDAVRTRSYGPLLIAALVLAMLAGGGYGIWLNRDAFGGLLGLGSAQTAADAPAADAPASDAASSAADAPAAATPGEEPKFTQRLTPEGNETDPGPASGEAGVGEGTSVAALTQPAGSTPPIAAQPGADPQAGSATDPAAAAAAGETGAPSDAATPPDAALAIGQKAIFYEERTSSSEGSAEPGSTVWSLVQESPGGNLPPEPAVRAEATIPGKDIKLRMTIKRNADQTLPASHIIEMIFLTPADFPGGGVENILRVAMKGSEQEAGNPLIGIPAKIADGFFLVALNDTKAEIDANMTLLRRQSWIDVPIVYKSGRRALFTMEKGIPGDKVFDEALKAWAAASAATTTAPG